MTKKCSSCKTEKDEVNFRKHKHSKDGLSSQCKECLSKIDKRYRDYNKTKIHTRIPGEKKQCSMCRLQKDVSEFSKHGGTKDGLEYVCKVCKAELDKKRDKTKWAVYCAKYYEKHKDELNTRSKKQYQELKKCKEFCVKNNLMGLIA